MPYPKDLFFLVCNGGRALQDNPLNRRDCIAQTFERASMVAPVTDLHFLQDTHPIGNRTSYLEEYFQSLGIHPNHWGKVDGITPLIILWFCMDQVRWVGVSQLTNFLSFLRILIDGPKTWVEFLIEGPKTWGSIPNRWPKNLGSYTAIGKWIELFCSTPFLYVVCMTLYGWYFSLSHGNNIFPGTENPIVEPTTKYATMDNDI